MYGSAKRVRTLFVQEKPDKNLSMVINEMLEELASISDVDVIDIKYASANDENGYGWHSALIIYKGSE
ncbi:sporulation protein Cse60 [Paenibacillus harenae]|uniref:sporulation protein Cse60 n=1 Tax=Paenibacillus harenae TaxID=306543 RepID=UPI000428A902|nr:sporulation protein Cse60 [Paenibacillus harenae]